MTKLSKEEKQIAVEHAKMKKEMEEENKKSFEEKKKKLSKKAKDWIGKKHIIKGDTVIELDPGPQKYHKYAGGGSAVRGLGRAFLKGGKV